jgi:hypothetical protein
MKRATTADLVGAYFSDANSARLIGTTYLQLVPAEAAQATLMTALAPTGEDPTQWWATIDGSGLQKAMRKRVHADFATPDVIDLGGWQLARTECRLAALWSVTHP